MHANVSFLESAGPPHLHLLVTLVVYIMILYDVPKLCGITRRFRGYPTSHPKIIASFSSVKKKWSQWIGISYLLVEVMYFLFRIFGSFYNFRVQYFDHKTQSFHVCRLPNNTRHCIDLKLNSLAANSHIMKSRCVKILRHQPHQTWTIAPILACYYVHCQLPIIV